MHQTLHVGALTVIETFADRTPYGVAPYGADNYPKHLGPAPSFVADGFIFVYQDVRGRFQSDGTFIEMTPHKDHKKDAKDVDESTDTYDTRMCPTTTAKRAFTEFLIRGFTLQPECRIPIRH